ncbi:MAG: phosphatidate cytidylyltransferase [Clostridia bacterium]|nr:phosphatidate cytidylyltransferase [Clostridia bacterium]
MKTRMLTAAIGIPALLLVMCLPWTLVFTCAMAFVSGVAVYEVLKTADVLRHTSLTVSAMIFSVAAPFFNRIPPALVIFLCLAYVVALLFIFLRAHKTISLETLGLTFFMSTYISVSLSCAAYLRSMETHGLFYLFLAFGIAWFADAGAYFVGVFFGKHKLCPDISPKKTVEGFFGGLASSLLLCLLMTWIYDAGFLKHVHDVSYGMVFLLALVGSFLSVIGDLFASLIKRQYEVKDFGNFFPGHGGMMDRFDSLLPVFLLVYFTVCHLPVIS